MKKRTMIIGGLLAASIANAGPQEDAAQYLNDQTGENQNKANELCLKVDVAIMFSRGPKGPEPIITGLQVAANTQPRDLVIAKNMQTNACDNGYIKITTTAPLGSIRNAPIGL